MDNFWLTKIEQFKENCRNQVANIFSGIHILVKYFQAFAFLAQRRRPWSYGYTAYKEFYIAKVLSNAGFTPDSLPTGYGLNLDERSVEYPWFFSRLPASGGKLLDAGSVLNYPNILSHSKLAGKDIFISTLAPEPYCAWKRKVSYVFEDLRSSCFRDGYFDWVASLSTVEHIGLDNTLLYASNGKYQENQPGSYVDAIKEYRRMLKPGGTLFLSVPFGAHVNHDWFQIFSPTMVDELIAAFCPTEIRQWYFRYSMKGWQAAQQTECAGATYYDVWKESAPAPDGAAASRAIVCLELKA